MPIESHSPSPLRAAGAVVWRDQRGVREVALVHSRKHQHWTLPKGKAHHGEHITAAAAREVLEETGVVVTLGPWIGQVTYMKSGWHKRVDYWSGRVRRQGAFVGGEEIDRVAWMPLNEAVAKAALPRDVDVLRALMARPVNTTPLILARHGQLAGGARDWAGKKKLRPLDDVGTKQARSLASVLAHYAPVRLISAPSVRCLETLGPYADEAGIGIQHEKTLLKKHFTLQQGLDLALGAMDGGTPTVICGYRDSLEELFTALCRQRFDGQTEEIRLFKSAFVIMHHDKGKIVSIERYLA
jgi:8-oxo-dGTP diphosphatase